AAAASLAALPLARARQALHELTRARLVEEHVAGRFACHDLLRAYAAEQAAALEDQAERTAALHRMLDHYLHSAPTAPRRPPPADGTRPDTGPLPRPPCRGRPRGPRPLAGRLLTGSGPNGGCC